MKPVRDPARPALRLRALEPFASFGLVLPVQVHREDDRDIAAHFPGTLSSEYAAYDILERQKDNVAVVQESGGMFWMPRKSWEVGKGILPISHHLRMPCLPYIYINEGFSRSRKILTLKPDRATLHVQHRPA